MNTLEDLQSRSVVIRRERGIILRELEENDARINALDADERAFYASYTTTDILTSVENKSLSVDDAALLLNREACSTFINFKLPNPKLPSSVSVLPEPDMFSEVHEWQFGQPWFRPNSTSWVVHLAYELPFIATQIEIRATGECCGKAALYIDNVRLAAYDLGSPFEPHIFKAKGQSSYYTVRVEEWTNPDISWISCIAVT